ncbi:hypothetical protein OSTOST_04194 [Ostertagia ostertagi]
MLIFVNFRTSCYLLFSSTEKSCLQKAIMECEDEYADNKKLIEIKDLRRQIPKNFSYFAVDFGLSNGYAHVIEHTESFPSTFAH